VNSRGAEAISLDMYHGTKSEIIEIGPVSWFEAQQKRWADLRANAEPGEAMSDIVIRGAIER
jgi:hypothetical protein